MRLNITLQRRVARLEKRHRTRRQLPTIITGIYSEEQPGPVIGIEGGGKRLRLKAGETLCQLRERALAEIPSRFLQMAYSAPRSVEAPQPAPIPVQAAVEAPSAPIAGIGRIASRAELEKFGAVPVPPERLI